ncbi:hypothetical protein [Amycolatopsis sp. NPDC051716]|uniref:hypothetical protein n=1 Tax=Amycolatopsis sp. NPDC051716 TaxID=3155804 RepID=UPI00341D0683
MTLSRARLGHRRLEESLATPAPATFTHQGVLVSSPQLDFVKAEVSAGAQPWKAAYDQARSSAYASLSRTPKPRAVVECG